MLAEPPEDEGVLLRATRAEAPRPPADGAPGFVCAWVEVGETIAAGVAH